MGKLLKKVLGFGIIGFILGLLFAPEKGEDTRKKVGEAIEKGKEKFNEVKSSKKVEDAIEKGKEKFNEVRSNFEKTKE